MSAAAPLCDEAIALEPLHRGHFDELVPILDDEIWRYQPIAPGALPRTAGEHADWLGRWFAASEAGIASGGEIVFCVRRLGDGAIVGSTRYLNIARAHLRLEIGGTFYRADARRTDVNTRCKRLLLARAFDELGCMRVELKCDARNLPSRTAIARLGATQEGIFRQHILLGDGHRRDTVYFAILDGEWPAIRARLDQRIRRSG